MGGILFRSFTGREEPAEEPAPAAPEAPAPAPVAPGPAEARSLPAEAAPAPPPEDPAARAAEEAKRRRRLVEPLRAIAPGAPEDGLYLLAVRIDAGAFRLADPPLTPEGLPSAEHVGTGLPFVLLPGGEYVMGASDEETMRYADVARPARPVKVRPFLLARTECTQSAWARGGGSDGCASAFRSAWPKSGREPDLSFRPAAGE